MGRLHEAEVELICQSNDPGFWRPLFNLPDHLKHTTSVLVGLDDHQGRVEGTILKALWTCDRCCLGNRKRRVPENVLKPRPEQEAVANKSRWDGWRKTVKRRDSLRRGILNKRERLRSHPCPLFGPSC